MDHTTQIAIRAIVNALHLSGALNETHVASVVAALQIAASEAGETWLVEHGELMELAKGIADDVRSGGH